MDILIREVQLEDYISIYRLNCDEMGYDYPVEKTKEKLAGFILSNQDKIYVAVWDDEIVGYVHANDYDTTYMSHMKNIMGIAVDASHKRQGIGRKLLEKVEEWAKETGAEGVRLVSGSTRVDAHTFYRSCGYSGDKMQLNLKKMKQAFR